MSINTSAPAAFALAGENTQSGCVLTNGVANVTARITALEDGDDPVVNRMNPSVLVPPPERVGDVPAPGDADIVTAPLAAPEYCPKLAIVPTN